MLSGVTHTQSHIWQVSYGLIYLHLLADFPQLKIMSINDI